MKTIFTTLFFFIFLVAFGQTQDVIEEELLQDFNRILYWRDHTGDNPNVNVYDSLLVTNEQFEKKLLKYTSQIPTTIRFDFKRLKGKSLSISTSDDGVFRIYSWDTWTGGTMHFQQNVFQYKAGDKIYAKVISEPLNTDDQYSINWYIQVFTVKMSTQTYYLGFMTVLTL